FQQELETCPENLAAREKRPAPFRELIFGTALGMGLSSQSVRETNSSFTRRTSVIKMRTVISVLASFLLTGITISPLAQDIAIPDPGLNAAIREALQKPTGPLTAADLLNLTELVASSRNIASVEGLEEARNLTTLQLQDNLLTDFVLSPNL